MSREQTYVPFPGFLNEAQEADFAAASYGRLISRVTLIAAQGGAPTSAPGAQFQFQIDSVLQAGTYTMPQAQARWPIILDTGIAIDAESVLTAVVLAAGGAKDISLWIESEATDVGTDENWIVPTAGDLQARIAATEWAIFTASALTTGQSDPVPQLLDAAVQTVRSAIESGRRTSLGPAGTIPKSALYDFISTIKAQFFGRLESLKRFVDAAKPDAEKAEKRWDAYRAGKDRPEAPTVVGKAVAVGGYGADDPIDYP